MSSYSAQQSSISENNRSRILQYLYHNGGQVGEGNTIAFQVEHCDLHQTSCEFHADDMVFRAIEIQADGTTILIAFHVSGFFDNVSEQ